MTLLIGDIYDAALDPARWPHAQDQVCKFVGGHASTLYWQDSARQTGNAYYQVGIEPEFERLYFEKYLRMNPLYPGLIFLGVEEVHSVASLISLGEWRATRFYKEWLRPQGFWMARSRISKSRSPPLWFLPSFAVSATVSSTARCVGACD